jgi:Biotin-lipoyl like
MIAVASGGHLRWQHFAHNPGAAAPKPRPGHRDHGSKTKFSDRANRGRQCGGAQFGIDFKDGQYVKKGQLLAQLDPSTYQARLDEAEVSAGSARVAPHG